jgi:hypothetical protein
MLQPCRGTLIPASQFMAGKWGFSSCIDRGIYWQFWAKTQVDFASGLLPFLDVLWRSGHRVSGYFSPNHVGGPDLSHFFGAVTQISRATPASRVQLQKAHSPSSTAILPPSTNFLSATHKLSTPVKSIKIF